MLCGCNDKDDYSPLKASTVMNGILISIESDEEDLLLEKEYTDNISIMGNQSKKQLSFKIIKLLDDSDGRNYISFDAEIPDIKDFEFDNEKEAYGQSTVVLLFDNKSIELKCKFKYICTDRTTYGNNSITIEEVENNGNTVLRENNLMNSDIVLYLDENGSFL